MSDHDRQLLREALDSAIRERDEAKADAERWRQTRIKDREIADGDVGCHIREVGRAHAKVEAAEAIIKEARRLIERSASIGEDHPAYGFLVMGIPLAKALAAFDAHRTIGSARDACAVCGKTIGPAVWCSVACMEQAIGPVVATPKT